MTEEATERLKSIKPDYTKYLIMDEDKLKAIQLGIETLERLQTVRETLVSLDNVREKLPSETVEKEEQHGS